MIEYDRLKLKMWNAWMILVLYDPANVCAVKNSESATQPSSKLINRYHNEEFQKRSA